MEWLDIRYHVTSHVRELFPLLWSFYGNGGFYFSLKLKSIHLAVEAVTWMHSGVETSGGSEKTVEASHW